MGRLPFDGNTKVYWGASVPTNKNAPTVAEIGAMTDITTFVTKDGLGYNPRIARVNAGNISTEFEAENMGTWGIGTSLRIQLDDTTNTAANLFTTHATAGVLVVIWNAGTASPAIGDKAYVIPAEASIAIPNNSATNELQTSSIELAVTSEPDLSATVA